MLKKTITSVIAAGAFAASTLFTPTQAVANPAIPAIVVAAILAGTFVVQAQPAKGTITVKASKSKKKR